MGVCTQYVLIIPNISFRYIINKIHLDIYKHIKDTWHEYPLEVQELLLMSIKANLNKLHQNQAPKAATEFVTAYKIKEDLNKLAKELRAQIQSTNEDILDPLTYESEIVYRGDNEPENIEYYPTRTEIEEDIEFDPTQISESSHMGLSLGDELQLSCCIGSGCIQGGYCIFLQFSFF